MVHANALGRKAGLFAHNREHVISLPCTRVGFCEMSGDGGRFASELQGFLVPAALIGLLCLLKRLKPEYVLWRARACGDMSQRNRTYQEMHESTLSPPVRKHMRPPELSKS